MSRKIKKIIDNMCKILLKSYINNLTTLEYAK